MDEMKQIEEILKQNLERNKDGDDGISLKRLISDKFRKEILVLMVKEIENYKSDNNDVDDEISKPFRKSGSLAEKFRIEGNKQFKNGDYWKSLIYYNMALCNSSIGNNNGNSPQEEPTAQSQIAFIYGNRSIVYAKIGQLDNAIVDIDRAIGYHYEAQSYLSKSPNSVEAIDNQCRIYVKKLLLRKLSHLIEAGRWLQAKVVQDVLIDDHFGQMTEHDAANSSELEYFEQCKEKIFRHLQQKHYNTINNSGRTRSTTIGSLPGSKSGCLKLLQVSGGFRDTRKIRMPMRLSQDRLLFEVGEDNNGGGGILPFRNYYRISNKIKLDPNEGFQFVVGDGNSTGRQNRTEIERSELLLVECPISSVCLSLGLHCAHCLVNLSRTSTVPCRSCNQFQYCSDRCEAILWSYYHQLECGQIGHWNRLRPVARLVLRLIQKLSIRTKRFAGIINNDDDGTTIDGEKLLDSMFLKDSKLDLDGIVVADGDYLAKMIYDTNLIQTILHNGNPSLQIHPDKLIEFQLILTVMSIVDQEGQITNSSSIKSKNPIVERIYESLPIQFCTNQEDGLMPKSIQQLFQTVGGLKSLLQNAIQSNSEDNAAGFVDKQLKSLMENQLSIEDILPRGYCDRVPIALALYPSNRFIRKKSMSDPIDPAQLEEQAEELQVSRIYNGKIRALRSRFSKTIVSNNNNDKKCFLSVVIPNEPETISNDDHDFDTKVSNLAHDLCQWNHLWNCASQKQDNDENVPRPPADNNNNSTILNESQLKMIEQIKNELLLIVPDSAGDSFNNDLFRLMLLANSDCWLKQQRSQYREAIQTLEQCIEIVNQLNDGGATIYCHHLRQQLELRMAHYQFELFTERQLNVQQSVQSSIDCLLNCSELIDQIYSQTFALTLIGNDIDQDDSFGNDLKEEDDDDDNNHGNAGMMMIGNESSMSAKDCLLRNNFPLLIELEDMMVACDIFSKQFSTVATKDGTTSLMLPAITQKSSSNNNNNMNESEIGVSAAATTVAQQLN